MVDSCPGSRNVNIMIPNRIPRPRNENLEKAKAATESRKSTTKVTTDATMRVFIIAAHTFTVPVTFWKFSQNRSPGISGGGNS